MASLKLLATVLLLLAILSFSVFARPTFDEYESSAIDQALAKTPDVVVSSQAVTTDPCHPRDINIQQYEASGVGAPVWKVQITNLCTNPLCMISEVIVQCGAFHTPTLVNPHVFRRLDPNAGTCIVNDGNKIGNAETVTFQYTEIMKESLTLKSAKVACW